MKISKRKTVTRHKKPYWQYFVSIPRKMLEKLGWEGDQILKSTVVVTRKNNGKNRLILELELDDEAEDEE